MSWESIWSTVVGAGLGTAIVQGAISLYQYNTTSASAARYLAIRLATMLEGFASQCLEQMYDQDTYMDTEGTVGRLYFQTPTFPGLPEDTEGWRRLRSDAVSLIFEFQADLEGHARKLSFISNDLMDHDEAFGECRRSCSELGLSAVRIAASLRSLYGFPSSRSDIAASIENAVAQTKPHYYRMQG